MKAWLRMLAIVGAVAVATTGSARATFVPVFIPGASTPAAGIYGYTLSFDDGAGTERLDPYSLPTVAPPTANPGSIVTIYDFDFGTNDPASSVIVPVNFAFTTQLVGINPDGTAPNDLATQTNVSFYYTGAALATSTTFPGFILTSTVTTPTIKQQNFTGQTTNVTTTPPTQAGDVGSVIVAGTAIPEPASAVLVGLGGLGCLILFRRHHRRRPRA
jgi:hypothetical protein